MILRALTLICLLVAIAIVAGRVFSSREASSPRHKRAETTRSWGGSAIRTPASWKRLQDDGDDHAAWADRDRTHTVTLGSTPAGGPLPAVVKGAAQALQNELRGAKLLAVQVSDQTGRIELALPARQGRLLVTQAWRRDADTGLDRIATWTSADGRWTAPPKAPELT